jgi:chromosome condensin MukBEF MukE localization factor
LVPPFASNRPLVDAALNLTKHKVHHKLVFQRSVGPVVDLDQQKGEYPWNETVEAVKKSGKVYHGVPESMDSTE